MTSWELTRHPVQLGLAQLPAHASVPRWAYAEEYEPPFSSVMRTDDELCVVCAYDAMPGTVTGVGPFVAFSVDGPLEHSLVGVLAGLLEPIAAAGVSILAQSTFDTDWILVAAAQAEQAATAWTEAGHVVTDAEVGS